MDYLPIGPLQTQLRRLRPHELRERLQVVRALSAARGLQFFADDGQPRTIDLALMPWIITPAQRVFFRQVAHLLADALMRLPSLYARDPAVRAVLPFDETQQSWLRLAAAPRSRPYAVLGRLDSTATFAHANWRRTFQMLEPNAVGVGGVYYAPTACGIIVDVLGDLLRRAYPRHRIGPAPDPRHLLSRELAAVAKRMGSAVRRVALLENRDYTTGTDEFRHLAHELDAWGLQAIVVDPRDVRLAHGHLTAKGRPVDFIYRDCELSEFIEIEEAGHRVDGMRAAIQQGRLISGLLWEFDQKSCWDVFTDPDHAHYFTPAQRRFFRAHVPWTRLVRDAVVTDPTDRRIDLVPYIRRHQHQLILKPNILYGGEGVVIGRVVTSRVWERTLSTALRGPLQYVAQRLARIHTERFPALERGQVQEVSRSVVSGFFFNSHDIGLVGRFSSNPVVNVSRGGGLLSALMVGEHG